MRYQELQALNAHIVATEKCPDSKYRPVVNGVRPTQRFLIISLDPSSDTNKGRKLLEKHSGFEERVIALFNFGSDDEASVQQVRAKYEALKKEFIHKFYWTHYSKCYSAGQPGNYWAKKYLLREIELAEPEAIIVFGGKVTDFLFGKGNFKERVNRTLNWRGIPVVCCLHPSRDWNVSRRGEYAFTETWQLIRKTTGYIN